MPSHGRSTITSHSPALASRVKLPAESVTVSAQPCPSIRHATTGASLTAVPSDVLTVPVMLLVVLVSVIVPKSFSAVLSALMLNVYTDNGSIPLKCGGK